MDAWLGNGTRFCRARQSIYESAWETRTNATLKGGSTRSDAGLEGSASSSGGT
jgi:hypothetical protein